MQKQRMIAIVLAMVMAVSCFIPASVFAGTNTEGKSFEVELVGDDTYVWEGTAITPDVVVKDGDTVLTKDTHYTVTYQDNKAVGRMLVHVDGIGDYSAFGAALEVFIVKTLEPKDKFTSVKVIGSTVYTGKALKPELEVRGNYIDGGGFEHENSIIDESDYSVKYKNNINAGTATVTVTGKGKFEGCTLVKNFTIKKANAKNFKVIKQGRFIYTGKAIKHSKMYVYSSQKMLTKGTHYTVSYKNNVNCGKATLIIKGKGKNFTGTKEINFVIVPKKANIKSLKGSKKAFTVTTYKNKGNVSGYEVAYATSKKVNHKEKDIKGKTTYKIGNLKKGKTYYVKVRAYKYIYGQKWYGDWSSYKTVKVK